MQLETRVTRPWTVILLVGLLVAGTLATLLVDPKFDGLVLLGVALNLLFVWALWEGKTWAFTLTFMSASLCAALAIVVGIVAVALFERSFPWATLWAILGSGILMALLLHPATKRFAGLPS